MKKIKLDLDRLDVESFAVTATRDDAGTVHGHVSPGCTPNGACETVFTCYSCDGMTCEQASCHLNFTCTDCGETCAETCLDTCG